MELKSLNMQARLNLISAIILLVGLGSAILIYLTAENDSGSVLGYEVVGGDVYPITPENSKMYEHDLELFGGKAAVLGMGNHLHSLLPALAFLYPLGYSLLLNIYHPV